MTEIKVIATGLRFPEGPVVLEDGSIAVVEIARGTISRVALDGTVSVIEVRDDDDHDSSCILSWLIRLAQRESARSRA